MQLKDADLGISSVGMAGEVVVVSKVSPGKHDCV